MLEWADTSYPHPAFYIRRAKRLTTKNITKRIGNLIGNFPEFPFEFDSSFSDVSFDIFPTKTNHQHSSCATSPHSYPFFTKGRSLFVVERSTDSVLASLSGGQAGGRSLEPPAPATTVVMAGLSR
jgi:hypothetical protein